MYIVDQMQNKNLKHLRVNGHFKINLPLFPTKQIDFVANQSVVNGSFVTVRSYGEYTRKYHTKYISIRTIIIVRKTIELFFWLICLSNKHISILILHTLPYQNAKHRM